MAQPIAFIGLGNPGFPNARNVLDDGSPWVRGRAAAKPEYSPRASQCHISTVASAIGWQVEARCTARVSCNAARSDTGGS